MKSPPLLHLLCGLALAFSARANAETIFSDKFASGTPTDSGYYLSAINSSLTISQGVLTMANVEGQQADEDGKKADANVECFFKQFDDFSLNTGETVTLSFVLRDVEISNNTIRVALGETAERLSGDQPRKGWRGYNIYQWLLPTKRPESRSEPVPAALSIRNVGGANNALLSVAGNIRCENLSTEIPNGSGQAIEITVGITRQEGGSARFFATMNGETLLECEEKGIEDQWFTFNTLAIGIGQGKPGRHLGISDITLTRSQAAN